MSTDNQDANYRAELHAAIDLSDAGKYRKALKALDRLVKNFPEEAQPRFERAMTLLNLDRDAEALADLEHVLAKRPDYPGARNWCAIAQAGLGKMMLAGEAKLAALTKLTPGAWAANGQAWADCAGYFLDAGAPDRALAALDIYFASYEGKQKGYDHYMPAPWRLRAKAPLALGHAVDALAAATRACSYAGSVPADQFVRLRASAAIGDNEGALDIFRRLKPDYEGTAPFNEAVAELNRLGLDVE